MGSIGGLFFSRAISGLFDVYFQAKTSRGTFQQIETLGLKHMIQGCWKVHGQYTSTVYIYIQYIYIQYIYIWVADKVSGWTEYKEVALNFESAQRTFITDGVPPKPISHLYSIAAKSIGDPRQLVMAFSPKMLVFNGCLVWPFWKLWRAPGSYNAIGSYEGSNDATWSATYVPTMVAGRVVYKWVCQMASIFTK